MSSQRMAQKATHRSYDLLWKEFFKEQWGNQNIKVGPAHTHEYFFNHKVIQESLCVGHYNASWIGEDSVCVDGHYNPSWIREECRRRGPTISTHAHDAKLCEENEKIIHDNEMGFIFVASLRACAKNKDLYAGTRVHHDILKRGLLEKCSNALVMMYAKCGALPKAKALLDMHKSRDVFSWTALIAGYAQKGQGHDALNCFEWMQHQGLSPDAVTFTCILKACGNMKAVEKGAQIHDEIARQGLLQNNIALGNALVDMYAKCGALKKAQRVLEELPVRNVGSWNALIAGYAQQGQGERALHCVEQMKREGLSPDVATFVCILKACGSIGAASVGKQIHDEIDRQGLLGKNIVLGNALVDMYAKCGEPVKAQQVLKELPVRNVVSWSALIAGYAQQGQGEQALKCFEQMQHEGLSPNAVTFTCILNACGSIGAADKGEQIHDKIARQGLLDTDIVLGNALVDMYAKCGALAKAEQVLEELAVRDVISWNALIAGYAQQGQGEQALKCFERMQFEGLCPNAVTFLCIFKACGSIGATDKGEEIHGEVARKELLGKDIVLGTALVDMYARCGALAKAYGVLEELPFRNVASWNALITGYVQQGQGERALHCFECMQREGLFPNAVSMLCILKACGSIGASDKGEQIHCKIAQEGLLGDDTVLGTALVNMYAKCGALAKARRVLERLPARDVASWFVLLGACLKWGDVSLGRWAFEQAVQVDKRDAGAYIVMANIYASAGMHEDAESIKSIRMENEYGKDYTHIGEWVHKVLQR